MTGDLLNKLTENTQEICDLMQDSDDKIDMAISQLLQACLEERDEKTLTDTIYTYEDRITPYQETIERLWGEE